MGFCTLVQFRSNQTRRPMSWAKVSISPGLFSALRLGFWSGDMKRLEAFFIIFYFFRERNICKRKIPPPPFRCFSGHARLFSNIAFHLIIFTTNNTFQHSIIWYFFSFTKKNKNWVHINRNGHDKFYYSHLYGGMFA